jgi:type III pantothenate kinase
VILLVDVGNTRIKWATLLKGKLDHRGDASRAKDPGTLAEDLEQHWRKLKKPRAVLISNVAGPACAEALSTWISKRWQTQARFVTPEHSAFGVTNAYTAPERLGPDRWSALIAVRRHIRGSACVIDAGTAVTIDVLDAQGIHQGGLIIPGLAMMRRALLEQTEDILPAAAAPSSGDATLLARDTQNGVNGGTLYTLVAVIDRVIADIGTELDGTPACIITGGDAAVLIPLLTGDYHHYPELVLQGLGVIAEAL